MSATTEISRVLAPPERARTAEARTAVPIAADRRPLFASSRGTPFRRKLSCIVVHGHPARRASWSLSRALGLLWARFLHPPSLAHIRYLLSHLLSELLLLFRASLPNSASEHALIACCDVSIVSFTNMDVPERFASPPSRPEAPLLSGFLTQPRPLPDPSAFSKLEKRRRSDMSDADSKTKAAVLECPEKPTKSPPLSRVFITRASHHAARVRFLWADPDLFPERRTCARSA